MKKLIVLSTAILLVLSMVTGVLGCQETPTPEPTPTPAPAPVPTQTPTSTPKPADFELWADAAITWAKDHIDSYDWYDTKEKQGYCLRFVANAFRHKGPEPEGEWDSAWQASQNLVLYEQEELRQPPRGALIFFDKTDKNQFGHVGIYLGDGRIIHSYGHVQIHDVEQVEKLNQGRLIGSYLGWAYPPERWRPQSTTPTPAPPPAEFELISLHIEPEETVVGKTVSITAVVENIGSSEGTYAAMLTIDGVLVEAKEVAITPGSSKIVTFSLAKDAPGAYEIGIGGLKSTLIVKEEAEPVVEKEDQLPSVVENIEIKYDDGTSGGAWAIGMKGKGHVVHFSPPVLPFRIDAIRIYGSLYGTGYEKMMVEIEVWDEDFNVLYSGEKPHTTFSEEPDWVTVDTPGIIVGGDFYIFVFTNSPEEGGLRIHYDSSVANTHSEVTWERKITDWYLKTPYGKEEVNWMIRVVQGSVLPPSGEAYESLQYFKTTEGVGIKYHVTDDYKPLDCNVWAVSQYFETNKPNKLDFVFTLTKEGTEGGYFGNSCISGEVSRITDGKELTGFNHGYPVGNQANFYFNFSLPRFFDSGDWWSWGDKEYSVEHVGVQTINGIEFNDCIKITIDDSGNAHEYLRGTGHFILARDIGIVELVFDRTSTRVMYEYVSHDQLTRHKISGNITHGGAPVQGIIVQIASANWGTRSVTDSNGSFSIQTYGPDIVLRIGYDKDNDDVFEFDDPNYPIEYGVNSITSDTSGLNVEIGPAP